MLNEIVSYDGHTLNGSDIKAWFPHGMPMMPGADKEYSERSRNWQKLSSKKIQTPLFFFHIELKGTIHSQYETVKAWFPILDYTPRVFIVKDTADSNRQWYVKGYAVSALAPTEDGAGEYVMELAVDEPLWRTVDTDQDAWAITASGQTKALTISGNHMARPIFTVTMSGAKNGGYAYKLWKPWYNPLAIENNEPLDVTNGGINTATIINDTTVSNQLAGAIDAAVLSFAIDTAVGGGLNTAGGLMYVGTEQIYYTGISAGTVTVYDDGAGTTGRGWGGSTAAVHADNAVCARSKMQANGNDLRVFSDRAEVDCWVTGINTATTKVWINPKYKAGITLISDTTIASSGSVTSITAKKKAANLAALKLLPATFLFYIGSEVFFGYNVQSAAYSFSVSARSQKGTSMAAHAKGATIRVLEHDVYLMWGNALAETPVIDTLKQPSIDMATSTNISWVHATFASVDGLRTAAWKFAKTKQTGDQSYIYTGPQATYADPATEIGFAVKAWAVSGVPKAENIKYSWSLYHPAGFTAVTASGLKRRLSTDWLSFIFQKLIGVDWSVIFTEATPAAAESFGALTAHSAVAISGNPTTVRFYCSGTLKATTGNENDFEVQDTTLAITSANVMQIAFATSVEDNIYVDAALTVQETGEAIYLRGLTSVNAVIVVDCDAETITTNGSDGQIDIQWNTVRGNWLDLPSPAQYATCTLRWDETGILGIGVSIARENRNTL